MLRGTTPPVRERFFSKSYAIVDLEKNEVIIIG
jgi:hypothetical protein